MPKRTNPFQELVSLIHAAWCRDGDKLTESAMVKVHGLDTEREIDVLFETSNGPYKVRIAVEVKDEGRPMDLDAFDRYVGEYRGPCPVAVDKFAVVSRNGFTKGVIEKAAVLGVPLLTLDEAKDFDWTNLRPEDGPLRQKSELHFRFPPHVCRVELVPAVPGDGENKAVREGRLICQHGSDKGTPFEFARRSVFQTSHQPTIDKLKELETLAQGRPNGAQMAAGFDMSHYKLRYDGKEHELKEMRVIVHMIDAKTPIECKVYSMDVPEGERIFHLSGMLGDRRIQWVMPQGMKSKKIAMRIGETPKQRAERRKKDRKRGKKSD